MCKMSDKPIVLFIDEVDSATNNQVFLDFLAQLRSLYLKRKKNPKLKTFQSVILAGVTDVKNLKRKLRPDEAAKVNSPWNIAVDFLIDMSLSAEGIAGMLSDYEEDHNTSMDVKRIAQEIRDYTGGYPFLVCRICQILDGELAGTDRFYCLSDTWTSEGINEAVRIILFETNTLFDSLMGKLYDNEELCNVLKDILFGGEAVSYNPDKLAIADARMYGFIKIENGKIVIANRIFETRLYNYFLGDSEIKSAPLYSAGSNDRDLFIKNGHLDMDKVLERFVISFDDLYGDDYDTFDEDEGRRRFLLYIRPIINGTGNYYVEAQTRNNRRMDVVIDYLGERFVVELKIWRGNAYNERGEEQLSDYLDYFHIQKGYMLSYNFNRNKEVGVKTIPVGDKVLVEAVV
ncbi:MAG: 9-O-acetyl-N-acetylneuraminate esterase, partial [Lachnospiraceae bacterium]|nr:9-O-acetyl-N-acetylneuraminate esterase [Lachnospiraceae bacterium]